MHISRVIIRKAVFSAPNDTRTFPANPARRRFTPVRSKLVYPVQHCEDVFHTLAYR